MAKTAKKPTSTKTKVKAAAKGKTAKAAKPQQSTKTVKTAKTVKIANKTLTPTLILKDLTAHLKKLKAEEKALNKENATHEKALKKAKTAQTQKAHQKSSEALATTGHEIKKAEALIATIEQFENKWAKRKPAKVKTNEVKTKTTKASTPKTTSRSPTLKTKPPKNTKSRAPSRGMPLVSDEITQLDLEGDFVNTIQPTENEENTPLTAEERERMWLNDGERD